MTRRRSRRRPSPRNKRPNRGGADCRPLCTRAGHRKSKIAGARMLTNQRRRTVVFMKIRKSVTSAAVCAVAVIVIHGCGAKEKPTTMPSTNMNELAATVEMDIPGRNGRFEIFGTPESGETVPGPTFAVSMVEEFDSAGDAVKHSSDPSASPVWVAPNANRTWLSAPFRMLLEQYANKEMPTDEPHCAPVSATLKKSRKITHGFQCFNAGKLLVYLPIWAE